MQKFNFELPIERDGVIYDKKNFNIISYLNMVFPNFFEQYFIENFYDRGCNIIFDLFEQQTNKQIYHTNLRFDKSNIEKCPKVFNKKGDLINGVKSKWFREKVTKIVELFEVLKNRFDKKELVFLKEILSSYTNNPNKDNKNIYNEKINFRNDELIQNIISNKLKEYEEKIKRLERENKELKEQLGYYE